MPLEDIASNMSLSFDELIDEMEQIVESGTKLNIQYAIEKMIDEDVVLDIYDYFHEAETSSSDDAYKELQEDDIELEEIRLVRLKFLSEVAH